MLEKTKTYRDWLREEFSERSHRNPSYSLRAFARDLRILPSRLSDIFNGKQGLSRDFASSICEHLDWNTSEKRLFVTMVESEHARSRVKREKALLELKTLENQAQPAILDENLFAIIADWYHFALLELLQTENVIQDKIWMAHRLGISVPDIEQALLRLEKANLIRRETNGWIVVENFPSTTQDIPSKAIKKFHNHILEKAAYSLAFQSVNERDFNSLVVSIDPKDLPEIKEELRNFRRNFVSRFNKRAQKKEVYCLSMQVFPLSIAEGA